MSEDIDLKVVVEPVPISKSALRAVLSKTKAAVYDAIIDAKFPEQKVVAKSENRNINFEIWYRAPAEVDGPLRSHLLVELTYSPPKLPTVNRSMISYVNEVTGQDAEISSLECTSIDETAAEKLVSLTRKTAGDIEGSKPDVHDPFLIRHVYDLHWLLKQVDRATVLHLARGIIVTDAEQFESWFTSYKNDPRSWTRRALSHLAEDQKSRASYDLFLTRMVYGERVAYGEALGSVIELGDALWGEGA